MKYLTWRMTVIGLLGLTCLVMGATNTNFLLVQLRGTIASLQKDNVKLQADLAICNERRVMAEQWNVRFLLWLQPAGAKPKPIKQVPEIAMRYCLDHGGPNIPRLAECMFADQDSDGDVDQSDYGLWQGVSK